MAIIQILLRSPVKIRRFIFKVPMNDQDKHEHCTLRSQIKNIFNPTLNSTVIKFYKYHESASTRSLKKENKTTYAALNFTHLDGNCGKSQCLESDVLRVQGPSGALKTRLSCAKLRLGFLLNTSSFKRHFKCGSCP